MGQGAESCGGYEVEYDPYDDGLMDGVWLQQSGRGISVEKMSDRHIKNAMRCCKKWSRLANFSCESDKWDSWVSIFEDELLRRALSKKPSDSKKVKKVPVVRGKMQRMRCHCGAIYSARIADLRRGWGLSCSKRCAAIRRDFGRPPAQEC